MEIWHYWVIAGIGLMIWEIFTPGFVVGMMGLACFCGAGAHLLGYGATGQVAAFAAGLLVGFVVIRPLFLKYFYSKDKKARTNQEAMEGKTGLIIEAVDQKAQSGRVRVGGSDWKAVSLGGGRIPAETRVRIQRVEGATLIVEPINGSE